MKIRKINLLLLSLLIILFLAKITLISIAQSPSNQTPKEQSNQSNQTNQPRKERSTLEAIFAIFKERQKQKLGSRGVCLVSPGILEKENIIWHNQPLFVWQGNSSKVEIRLYNADNPRKPIWRQQVTQDSSELTLQQIVYTGKPLELGKIYDWEIFDDNDKSKEKRSFKIMDIEQYNFINEELKNLEKQLKQRKLRKAKITVKKANYFAEKGLFSDAITELSSLDNLSPEIEQEIQDSLNLFCITPQQ